VVSVVTEAGGGGGGGAGGGGVIVRARASGWRWPIHQAAVALEAAKKKATLAAIAQGAKRRRGA
jgi:hypothetical protein